MNQLAQLEREGLVDIRKSKSSIVCDMRYATDDNLTGKKLYDTPACFLREEVAAALAKAQDIFEAHGYGLKIWDAYRPSSVQDTLVRFVNNTDYTPGVSNHSRGIAVDITLVDLKTGEELIMPTDHDDLREAAHQDAQVTNPEVFKNRELLKAVMHDVGFTVYPYEWWHFDFLGSSDAKPLDIPI